MRASDGRSSVVFVNHTRLQVPRGRCGRLLLYVGTVLVCFRMVMVGDEVLAQCLVTLHTNVCMHVCNVRKTTPLSTKTQTGDDTVVRTLPRVGIRVLVTQRACVVRCCLPSHPLA